MVRKFTIFRKKPEWAKYYRVKRREIRFQGSRFILFDRLGNEIGKFTTILDLLEYVYENQGKTWDVPKDTPLSWRKVAQLADIHI